MNRIKLPRPTAAELAAALSPSTETAQVEIAKPVHDYLMAKLHDRTTVSAYVSDRITTELQRLSKMKSGGNHTGWKTSPEQRAANARKRWDGVPKADNVKVRAFDEPHKSYMELADRNQERTRVACDVILEWCEAIDRDALLAWCESHTSQPTHQVTIPRRAVDAAKVIANANGVTFTKVVNFILEQEL